MTISSEVRKAGPFAGNDVATSFPFTFKVFSDADVLVVQADALGAESTLDLGSDYTVTLNADQNVSPGGTVTLPAALATGQKLVLSSQVAPLQPVDLTNSGGFYPDVINKALDRATILVQQLSEKVDRTVKVSITSGLTPDQFVEELQQGASDASASAAAAAASAAAAALFDPALYALKTASVEITSATGSAKIPAGTTAQRDGTPVTGATRFNTTLGKNETWNGTSWVLEGGGSSASVSLTGTSVAVTGIPAWANEITIVYRNASTNGNADPLFRVGDGAEVTTGYSGGYANVFGSGSCVWITSTAGLATNGGAATVSNLGVVTWRRLSGNVWLGTYTGGGSDGATYGSAVISLAGVLDRVSMAAGGADSWDAGEMSVYWRA
jgi:hypothetical protein